MFSSPGDQGGAVQEPGPGVHVCGADDSALAGKPLGLYVGLNLCHHLTGECTSHHLKELFRKLTESCKFENLTMATG